MEQDEKAVIFHPSLWLMIGTWVGKLSSHGSFSCSSRQEMPCLLLVFLIVRCAGNRLTPHDGVCLSISFVSIGNFTFFYGTFSIHCVAWETLTASPHVWMYRVSNVWWTTMTSCKVYVVIMCDCKTGTQKRIVLSPRLFTNATDMISGVFNTVSPVNNEETLSLCL